MIQNNYFNDNADVQLQFKHILDWDEVVRAYEGDFLDAAKYRETGDEHLAYAPSSTEEAQQFYRVTLEAAGDLAGSYLAPAAAEMDRTGLKYNDGKVTFPAPMVEAFEKFLEAGIHPYAISRDYGGLGMPLTAQCMQMEVVSRADGAFSIAMGCLNLAETIERYADADMIKEWVPRMAAGEICGAMALTEPNYGSDLPNLRTRAEKDENGNWRLTGTKRFITHACGFDTRPSVILTLARTGSSTSGAKGLSFFLVKSEDVHVASIEKKLGLHCSPTCEVVYENSPATLIGKEGHGLVKYAMGMMNSARLSIAAQSMGIATAAQMEAKKYASEREQFGKTIDQIPGVKKMLDRMDREVAAMRCLLYEAARSVDMYTWRQHRMQHEGIEERQIRKDEELRKWERLANYFTPTAKYYISEGCNNIADDALQIHGGSGYTEEYDVARIYRDARITNIYEGTTQLQMHAAIGGVTAGMSSTGHLRAYIDEQIAGFEASPVLKNLQQRFDVITEAYRKIENSEEREYYAFEAVESSARFICGLLLERSAHRLPDDARAERLNLARQYNLDSLAILQANQVRIESAVGEPEPAMT